MDVAAAPAPPDEPGLPPPGPPGGAPPREPSDRIIGGVAGLIAARLGLDALWIRMAFVILTLVGGLGLLVYAGLWLTLVVGARPGRTAQRVLGGAILLVAVPLMISGDLGLLTGPEAVLGLLVGITVALWQSRAPETDPRPAEPPPAPAPRPLAARLVEAVPEPPPAGASAPPARRRRARSILGRVTLGLALVVAATGALIDDLNGGRMHPEQWLGLAAAVCAVGVLVGAVWGYARWLLVPGLVFAGAGFVAGVAARTGVELADLAGERHLDVAADWPSAAHVEELAFGEIHVDVRAAPVEPGRILARVGVGTIRVSVDPDVTVEVRGRPENGALRINGVPQREDRVVVGPEGEPDVVVEARLERGSIRIEERGSSPPFPDLGARLPDLVPEVPGQVELERVAPGVAATPDGWIVLALGDAVIDPNDQVAVGESFPDGSITAITTSAGEYRLLPGSLLLTPNGQLLDLVEVRRSLVRTEDITTPTTQPGPGD